MTYWASFVCRCVRGRLIQVLRPLIRVIRITFSLFSFHIVQSRQETSYESARPFLLPKILFPFVVFRQYTLATENAAGSVIQVSHSSLSQVDSVPRYTGCLSKAPSKNEISNFAPLTILLSGAIKLVFGERFFAELFNFVNKLYCYHGILHWERSTKQIFFFLKLELPLRAINCIAVNEITLE